MLPDWLFPIAAILALVCVPAAAVAAQGRPPDSYDELVGARGRWTPVAAVVVVLFAMAFGRGAVLVTSAYALFLLRPFGAAVRSWLSRWSLGAVLATGAAGLAIPVERSTTADEQGLVIGGGVGVASMALLLAIGAWRAARGPAGLLRGALISISLLALAYLALAFPIADWRDNAWPPYPAWTGWWLLDRKAAAPALAGPERTEAPAPSLARREPVPPPVVAPPPAVPPGPPAVEAPDAGGVTLAAPPAGPIEARLAWVRELARASGFAVGAWAQLDTDDPAHPVLAAEISNDERADVIVVAADGRAWQVNSVNASIERARQDDVSGWIVTLQSFMGGSTSLAIGWRTGRLVALAVDVDRHGDDGEHRACAHVPLERFARLEPPDAGPADCLPVQGARVLGAGDLLAR